MRAGVLVAIGGAAAVLVATVPASAFNSGSDPVNYYGAAVRSIEAHRGWQGTVGVAFEPVGAFTPRMPDDEFDDILLNLVNWFRSEQGLAELEQFEPLRAQSAIRSNQLADAGSLNVVDDWYASDAAAACNPLTDAFSASNQSTGNPQDVFTEWTLQPATRNALQARDPGAIGIATVSEGGVSFTTIRIAHGTCPGSGMPFRAEKSGLPTPTIQADTDPGRPGLSVVVDRRGEQQLVVQIQRAEGYVWREWREIFLQPRSRPVQVTPPGGVYRVVVPEQSGYDVAFTEPLEVIGPPVPVS